MQRKSLTDILRNGSADALQKSWDSTEAAKDFMPLPAGDYTCHITAGELYQSKTGTPGYKMIFKVIDGEHVNRLVWHELWLTPAALPMTKRDLQKIGVTSLEQLERPLPVGIRCNVKVVLRRDDDGTDRNRVKSFEVIGIDAPEVDPFAPAETTEAEGGADHVPQ